MRKKRREFTCDIARASIEIYLDDVEIIAGHIRSGDLKEGWNFSALATSHELLALSCIATGDYGRSLGHLGAAAASWAALLEATWRGAKISQDVIDIVGATPFLHATAAGDEALVQRLIALYERLFIETTYEKPAHYVGMLTRALVIRDSETAKEMLASPPADLDPPTIRFWRSVAEHDEVQFKAGLARLNEWWRERVQSEHLEGMPDAVGDLFSLGAIKFTERLWHEELNITTGNIPMEYFSASAEVVPTGI